MSSPFKIVCTHSSVGRALVLYTGGPWFESKWVHGVLKGTASEESGRKACTGGPWFESKWVHYMTYKSLSFFLSKIEKPNGERCRQLWHDFRERFELAPGALRKHQAWKGGYVHHLEETMNLGMAFYKQMDSFRALPFSFSDVVLILFLHDLEKPFRYVPTKKEFGNDIEKHDFIESLIQKYKIKLSASHKNALAYVHGEGNDFSRTKRVQKPLAAFVHCLDTISARVWFDEPRKSLRKRKDV